MNIIEVFNNNDKIYLSNVDEKEITNLFDAMKLIALEDDNPGIQNYVEGVLKKSLTYKALRAPATPSELKKYKKKRCDESEYEKINNIIKNTVVNLQIGQYLCRCGKWENDIVEGEDIITARPLSTSLCPVTAFNNILYQGKAYEHGKIDFMYFRIANPEIKVFAYNFKLQPQEFEVLLPANTRLELVNRTIIMNDKKVFKTEGLLTKSKDVPVYILEIDIV